MVLMLFFAIGNGISAGGDDDKPQPEFDIYGGPPLCC